PGQITDPTHGLGNGWKPPILIPFMPASSLSARSEGELKNLRWARGAPIWKYGSKKICTNGLKIEFWLLMKRSPIVGDCSPLRLNELEDHWRSLMVSCPRPHWSTS